MPPSRAAPLGNGPDELHADRVYLEVTRDADGPGKLASREPLAKRRAQPVTGVRQHTAEPPARRVTASIIDRGQLVPGTKSDDQFECRTVSALDVTTKPPLRHERRRRQRAQSLRHRARCQRHELDDGEWADPGGQGGTTRRGSDRRICRPGPPALMT